MATYFITITCYGTWLHGDERGSHDRKGTTLGTAILAPDAALEAQMRLRMKHPEMRLNGPMRKTAREAVVEHCAYRGWELCELSVRTNHIHLVLVADAPCSRVVNSIKARATRILRESKLVPPNQPIWTERASCRSLETSADVADTCDYVRNGQGPDLPDD